MEKTINEEAKYLSKLRAIRKGLMEDLLMNSSRVNHLIEK